MTRLTSLSSNRRVFMMQVASAATAALVVSEASPQAMVDEKDPQAAGLAYKADATKVDKAKNPKFAAGSNCANCALFQGKAGAAAGGCPIPNEAGWAKSRLGWKRCTTPYESNCHFCIKFIKTNYSILSIVRNPILNKPDFLSFF